MYVTNPGKTVAPDVMTCGDTTLVTLSFDAAAALSAAPADIVLIMDRSSSITGGQLQRAKAAALDFIQIVAEASGDGAPDEIRGDSRMGLVSFCDTALEEVPLTGDTAPLRQAVAGLTTQGFTNHRAAFEIAQRMLMSRDNVCRIAVLFTDGVTTVGGDAGPTAQRMKDLGMEIYCIGLLADPQQINTWASKPTQCHVAHDTDPQQLDQMFRSIGAEVVQAGVQDAVIREEVEPGFQILQIRSVTDGHARITGPRTLLWTIDEAGLTRQGQPVVLTFEIMYTGTKGGILPVNREITYEDRAGNQLTFPSPVVEVQCSGAVLFPEPCPSPLTVEADGCRDSAQVHLEDVVMSSLGRIVQVDVTIRNVCPGRAAAAAVVLTEVDDDGMEHDRGMKTVSIPPLTGTRCQDVTLRCIRFVVPETLDPEGSADSICNLRQFRARAFANYTQTDFICCSPVTSEDGGEIL